MSSSHSHTHFHGNPNPSNHPMFVPIHSNGNFSTNKRMPTPLRHTHPPVQQAPLPLHIAVPPPPSQQTFGPVIMSVPPPFHMGVHPPPSYSTRPPPPIATAPNVIPHVQNGNIPLHVISPSVHIHHGQLVSDSGLVNGLPPAVAPTLDTGYYQHPAISHHHHHQPIVPEMGEVSVTLATTTPPNCRESIPTSYTNGYSPPALSDYSTVAAKSTHLVSRKDSNHQTQNHNQNGNEKNIRLKDKTPMCLINELSRHNKMVHLYRLLDESGPSHKKNFTVCLKIGDVEEFLATGPSIKKAQHAAAALALEKTKLKHPPSKPKPNSKQVPITPTVELNMLAMKRGDFPVYTFLENTKAQSSTSHNANKFNDKRYTNGYASSNLIRVSLKVGSAEFFGEALTAQAAKHNAAINALKVYRTGNHLPPAGLLPTPPNPTTPTSSTLNPKSVPFVPSSLKPNFENRSAQQQQQQQQLQNSNTNKSKEEEAKSPISMVHESALKRNMVVQFEVTKETGPPHMRKFITRCRCGDMISDGEGNCKKASKKRSAEMMLERLKQLPPNVSCLAIDSNESRNSRGSKVSSKKAEMKKKKAKNLIKIEQKTAPDYGQSINPISRLIQIQQSKKEKDPEYTLVAEKGVSRRREFVMQVTVGETSAKGSGPNKKIAKRAAAEALLQELGYCQKLPGWDSQPGKPVLKPVGLNYKTPSDAKTSNDHNPVKKLTFSGDSQVTKQPSKSTPGLLVLPSVSTTTTTTDSTEKLNGDLHPNHCVSPDPEADPKVCPTPTIKDSNHNNKSERNIQSILSTKTQLSSLADALNLKLHYRLINKKGKNENFISLVKLMTTPPMVFYGTGTSQELSEIDAASKALLAIADSGLEDDLNESQK